MKKSNSKASTRNLKEATLVPSFDGHSIQELKSYQAKKPLRFVTSTALFDGHDASINIIRRVLQARGCEVIHLGHNRTAREVAMACIEEDAHAIAVSSYQGGHVEYFKYMRKILDEEHSSHVRIFGGGGGVVTLDEISHLQDSGIQRIYSPEDGLLLGLEGIIGHMLKTTEQFQPEKAQVEETTFCHIARTLSAIENRSSETPKTLYKKQSSIVLGITGTGGAGKSSLIDEIVLRFLQDYPDIKIGVICVDPSKKKTGGALLGDRIRMNTSSDDRVYLRSFASRGSGKEISLFTKDAVEFLRYQDFNLVIVETSGIGQGNSGILDLSDLSLYVMTPEYGAQSQLEKIDMLDYANFIAINKFERRRGMDAFNDVVTTVRRSRHEGARQSSDKYPIFGTIASRFNDDGVSGLYQGIVNELQKKDHYFKRQRNLTRPKAQFSTKRDSIIPATQENYLTQITGAVRNYHKDTQTIVEAVFEGEALEKSARIMQDAHEGEVSQTLEKASQTAQAKIDQTLWSQIEAWPQTAKQYSADEFIFRVRDKEISVSSSFTTLSHIKLPRVAVPKYRSKADLASFLRRENLPGRFPFTAGIFPFRRRGEDPKRQFAGEGGPLKTNQRFHYLCEGEPAKRLSTAFDSVTLYGENPDKRPDIYGKIGESGVSIAHLDDMKTLYKGFDLCASNTSVSMTINGPAPILLALFFNTAIDQQVDVFVKSKKRKPTSEELKVIQARTLRTVRGTVQADILKEDQAQNTCLFSIDFALKMMGDIQQYFVEHEIKNYYAVSISGYHIAEAGANPITQLAFTLANGFTYVEYYLSRGLKIDDFAPNLSFFFSNGIDAEYAVIGRAARRIWAIALKDHYGASEKSQKLKYHIQTSGRSLHAQEMAFNDIRTTLQALMAIYDNCNSLHTNAYDEALTTPTEESVRRAMAIQLIINKEFGLNMCENTNQGSFIIEELTDLVEEAVLIEFERLSRRGGVLGAMETQYQRSKIQEESLYYEERKHSGKLEIIGVNSFLNKDSSAGTRQQTELTRSNYDEKDDQLKRLETFKKTYTKGEATAKSLDQLRTSVLNDGNIFEALMDAVRFCSVGEITHTLFELGGKYRRSM